MRIYLLPIIAVMGILSTRHATGEDLPKVLIIGDSISIGYMTPLVELLKGEAQVEHNPGNAAHSAHGLANLDAWLGDTEWDVIHFNHGLHDLKYVDAEGKNADSKELGHIQIPVEDYEKNLEAIVARLQETGANLIFATTTPFPDKVEGPLRKVEDLARYNDAALRVMHKFAVAVDDLHSFALPRLAEIQRPNNVHFTPEGSRILAQEVARHIRASLAGRKNTPKPASPIDEQGPNFR